MRKHFKFFIRNLAIITGFLMLASFAYAADDFWCDCYQTDPINEADFVQGNTIHALKTECKPGYFMTRIIQTPEENPGSFGQYILVSQVTCCRPCTDKEADKSEQDKTNE